MLISNAYAQAADAAADGGLLGLLPMLLMFVVLYFVMIRPQMKRAKEHKNLVEALAKGDEVMFAGVVGRITSVGDTYAEVEVADNVVLKIQKQAVANVLPKGTLKSI
ncbi:MAG: preprotein translocase subunit YajC [Rhodocyclaceae bacterium]|nr:preprotein translocase subunit YajC [Rhodocyclaceae bacterium]MCB1960714.1 preprotein translocase subunit YajC [Rhodocyclaceae bacterium]MCB1964392.1 preprotein translocase subunit YajC [Rhodocyclaceae bacterium]